MAPLRPLSHADHDRALAQITRRAALAEYDRGIIKTTRQVIRRSRELLEETKHRVPRSYRQE